MNTFKATIDIIGINPFVFLPAAVLTSIQKQANKTKSPIRVKGTIGGHDFTQTLVKYSGDWRLYINGPMLKAANKKVGDTIVVKIEFNTSEKKVLMNPKLEAALDQNEKAKQVFNSLSPSRQNEIVRYIANLKSEAAIEKNVRRAVQFLLGKDRFIGRDHP